MTDSLLGIVDFSTAVFCAKDALGQTVNISVGAQRGVLRMPLLPRWQQPEEDPLHTPLLGPPPAETWKRGNSLINWGMPWSYPAGYASVERALIEFPPPITAEAAQEVYGAFPRWLKLFEQYVTLITTQNTRSFITGGESDRIELFGMVKSDLRHIPRTGPINIEIELSSRDHEALQLSQLVDACRLASSGLSPRLEYRMMLEAYRARRDADYRKAIIEAATALEVCLTERALVEFSALGISFGDQLLKKYRTLGGRFELIGIVGISLPDKNYRELVINPRNEVIHRADFPGKALANTVIAEVEELLRLLSPQLNKTVTTDK